MPFSIKLALTILVIAAAGTDLRIRRIPNWITVPGAAVGFALQAYSGGLRGALSSLAGAGLGLAIFITLYVAGGMGAGDVKLFGAVGALTGPEPLVLIFVLTGLLGGIAAAVLAASRGRLRATLERTGELLLDLGRLRWQEVRKNSAAPDALRLPYGAVIAGGALLSLVVLH